MTKRVDPDLAAAIRDRYQRFVGARGRDGAKRLDAVTAIADQLRDEGVDLHDVYEQIVAKVVADLDSRDRERQQDTLGWAVDALNGDSIMGRDDPILDLVCAVGGGVRKAYRFLDYEDLQAIVTAKARHLNDSATALALTSERVQALTAAMRTRHVDMLGDLYG